MRSRSRLRSSSLVTKHCALPCLAASRISSSSGSRQTSRAPEVSTTAARAAISLRNLSASPPGYLNFLSRRGRLRTSASSASCESDVTTLNLLRLQAATTLPGGPEGFRKAETQTLVSSRATSGTALCLNVSAGLSDCSLDFFLRYRACSSAHFAHKTFNVVTPLVFLTQGNGHTGFFFQTKGLKRPKNAFFKDCLKSLFYRSFSLLMGHGKDYNGDPTVGSIAMEATR